MDRTEKLEMAAVRMTVDEILTRVRELCRCYGADEVLLFGSRAKGTDTDRSDFDLAVSGVEEFEELQEEIEELPTLYSFDVINLDTCRNEQLLEEIRKYGRKI